MFDELLSPDRLTATYEHDPANRILSMLYQTPSAQIENLLYEYDEIGNRTKFTRDIAQTTRNAVSGASYNDANHMLTFAPETASPKDMTYDNNGNLLTVSNGCGTTTFTWSARNKLTAINGYNADCSALTASFKYDAMGRRIEKTINGATTQYLYDGLDIIQEIRGTNKTNYVRTLNIDEPLTRIKADGTVRHYVLDALGSVIALTDDNGNVKTTYSYDPFGCVTVAGETSDNPFQYTGRENDGTGLYYYRARYYSPELQRFISEDPIGLRGGINKFSYTHNNPVNWIDPLGLDWRCHARRLAMGSLMTAKGFTTLGIAGTPIVLTAMATGNPWLTGIVTIEMLPVFWLDIKNLNILFTIGAKMNANTKKTSVASNRLKLISAAVLSFTISSIVVVSFFGVNVIVLELPILKRLPSVVSLLVSLIIIILGIFIGILASIRLFKYFRHEFG